MIGWARLFPWKQRGFDVVEDLVYVDPVHHGRGIGRALLTELIKEARGLGYRTIVATIATDNRSGLALHSRLGFEVVGTIKDAAHKFDRWMDITLVQRSLDRKGISDMDVRDEVVSIISGFGLFAGLSTPELDLIARVFEEAWFGEGDRILRQGFSGSSFYIILEGTASIRVDRSTGRAQAGRLLR